MDREKLIGEIKDAIHEMIHENGRYLDAADWQQIFAEVHQSAFAGLPDDEGGA